jgi:hypothetical protein
MGTSRKGAEMFYGIEYAYGRSVVNHGQRADRVLEFTAKRLRDAWIEAGALVDGPGARDAISARNPLVRKATGLIDGDADGWQALAADRVDTSAALARYRETINADWAEADHYKWVATAPEREIVSWAKSIEGDYKASY